MSDPPTPLGKLLTLAHTSGKLAPVLAPVTFNYNYATFLEEMAVSATETTAILYWMYYHSNSVANPGHDKLAVHIPKSIRAAVASAASASSSASSITAATIALPVGSSKMDVDAKEGSLVDPHGVFLTKDVPSDHLIFWIAVSEKSTNYLLDLTVAEQTKALRERNVDNYFRSVGANVNAAVIHRSLHYFASAMPSLIRSAGIKARIVDSAWLMYHTTVASTPALVSKFVAAVRTIAASRVNEIVCPDIDVILREAIIAPWDANAIKRIPVQVVAKTHAYLKAVNRLPDGWFQGEKSKDSIAPAMYERYVAIFKRANELQSNRSAIEGAVDIAALAVMLT